MVPAVLALLVAVTGALWKSLGRLCKPLLRRWLSGSPSLGFVHLASLNGGRLEKEALALLSQALAAALPLRAVQVSLERLTVSIGPLVGLRLRASGVHIELEWVPEDDWAAFAEDLRAAERERSRGEAAAAVRLVRDALAGKGDTPGPLAQLIEAALTSVRLVVEDVRVSVGGSAGPDVDLSLGVRAHTARCRAVEWRGAQLRLGAGLALRAGGQQVLEPLDLDATVQLPRLVRTLLAPRRLAGKRARASISAPRLALAARPAAVGALARAGQLVGRFAGWHAQVLEEARAGLVPLGPGEAGDYLAALRRGEDVSAWEQRMTCAEILVVQREHQGWPVPKGLSPEQWVRQLREERKPVREFEVSVDLRQVSFEVLGDSDAPGTGLHLTVGALRAAAELHDVEAATLVASATSEDMVGLPTWEDAEEAEPAAPPSTAPAAAEPPLAAPAGGESAPAAAAADGVAGGLAAGAAEVAAVSAAAAPAQESSRSAEERGPTRFQLEVALDSVQAGCEPPGALAVPLLVPCSLSATCRVHRAAKQDTVVVDGGLGSATGSGAGVVATVSSRALWKLKQLGQALLAALPPPSPGPARGAAAGASTDVKRREAHLAEVQKLFRALDTDGSGRLSEAEVRVLIDSVYGRRMTIDELQVASAQLYAVLNPSNNADGVALQALQDFFSHDDIAACVGNVCWRLGEFTQPVDYGLDAVALFRRSVQHGDEALPAEVLQLRWVRAVRNYAVARRLWDENIAPLLGEDFKAWHLTSQTLAIDFWNDPTFKLHRFSGDQLARVLRVEANLHLDCSFSWRLADTQHISSTPRVQVDVTGAQVGGGIQVSAGNALLLKQSLRGAMHVRAHYWNEGQGAMEPFLEPWGVQLQTHDNVVQLHAKQHLVANITPQLLQALSVAAGSLQASEKPAAAALSAPQPALVSRPVVAWVSNQTSCDLVVRCRGPAGRSQPVEIRSTCADLVAVELEGSSEPKDTTWLLRMDDGEGRSWSQGIDVPFAQSGRHVFSVGCGVVVASVTVDVHSLAPVVAVSGINTLVNGTGKTLSIRGNSGEDVATLGPQASWTGPLGGGHIVSLPVTGDGQLTVQMPRDDEEIPDNLHVLKSEQGYRFVLSQSKRGDTIQARTLLCVPLLRILNGLPCEIKCSARSAWALKPTPEEEAAALRQLAPGAVLGLEDVKPDNPVLVSVTFLGSQYSALLPKGLLDCRSSVMHARALIQSRRRNAVALVSQEWGAPHLDVELDWDNNTAVLVVYAKYWVANKTGWELEAWSGGGMLESGGPVGLGTETVTPRPLQGAIWDGAADGSTRRDGDGAPPPPTPELGFMRAPGEQVRLRLRGKPSATGWAWDRVRERAALGHWTGTDRADWETGWSPSIDIAASHTGGVADLPSMAGLGLLPGASVGVTVQGLPPPFERSRLLTVLPRRIVRNGLAEPVELWPSLGSSRRPPAREADLLGTWFYLETGKYSISKMLGGHYRLDEQHSDGKEVFGLLEQRGRFLQAEIHDNNERHLGTVRLLWNREDTTITSNYRPVGAGDFGPDIVARKAEFPILKPGCCLAIDAVPSSSLVPSAYMGGQEPRVSLRLPGQEQQGGWSEQVPLAAVGETVLALRGRGGRLRAVRASVQLEGATLCLVLVRGQWPHCIENRSVQHTVAFWQQGTDGSEEWIIKPGEFRHFVFPDPDLPRHLLGRILGAGERYVARYELEDVARCEQEPLRLPGRSGPALKVALHTQGATQYLVLSDPLAQGAALSREAAGSQAGAELGALGLDVFLAGFHVCLVNTLRPVPRELLALTIDFIQLEKPKDQRVLTLTVHSFQLDDFDREDHFIAGPLFSGLNSESSHAADDDPDFRARPWLCIRITGPTDPTVPVFDQESGIVTLTAIEVNVRPVDVQLEVPRLLSIEAQLRTWLALFELAPGGGAAAALKATLQPGFRTAHNNVGETLCFVGRFEIHTVQVLTNLTLRKRRRRWDWEEDGEEDLDTKLRRLSVRLWAPLRSPVHFVSRLGTTVAAASPTFTFAGCSFDHVAGSTRVLAASLAKHYQHQLIAQSASAIGSLQVLGDPAAFVGDVRGGFVTFVRKTKEEVTGQRAGIGAGVSDLAGGVVGGALSSVSKISGSLRGIVGSVSSYPVGSDRRAKSIAEGVDLGMECIKEGVEAAVTGLVNEPSEQFWADGAVGLAKGSMQGLVGVAVRPVEGFLGAVEKLAQGIEGALRGTRGYQGLRRPPRAAFTTDAVEQLQPLFPGAFWPTWGLAVLQVSLPALWKNHRVERLAFSLGQVDDQHQSEVIAFKAPEEDAWAVPEHSQASGRVGALRGPFQLRVFALVQASFPLSSPSKVLTGVGTLPTAALSAALVRPVGEAITPLDFDIAAAELPERMGGLFGMMAGDQIGRVSVGLMPMANPRVLPERFVPGLQDRLSELGPQDAAGLAE